MSTLQNLSRFPAALVNEPSDRPFYPRPTPRTTKYGIVPSREDPPWSTERKTAPTVPSGSRAVGGRTRPPPRALFYPCAFGLSLFSPCAQSPCRLMERGAYRAPTRRTQRGAAPPDWTAGQRRIDRHLATSGSPPRQRSATVRWEANLPVRRALVLSLSTLSSVFSAPRQLDDGAGTAVRDPP
jgi:hypothetical protein